jgi:hexosaminidase
MACPRYSPHNAPIPLKKGLHRLKVLFIGGIFAGWPTYWDDASVKMRRDGGEWTTLNAEHLKVTGRF